MFATRFQVVIAGAFAINAIAISSGVAYGAENIGGAKQLFIDNRIVASLGGASCCGYIPAP